MKSPCRATWVHKDSGQVRHCVWYSCGFRVMHCNLSTVTTTKDWKDCTVVSCIGYRIHLNVYRSLVDHEETCNSHNDSMKTSKLPRTRESHMPECVAMQFAGDVRGARDDWYYEQQSVQVVRTDGPCEHSCLHSGDAFVALLPSLLLHAALQMSVATPHSVQYCVATLTHHHARSHIYHLHHGPRHDFTSGTRCDCG